MQFIPTAISDLFRRVLIRRQLPAAPDAKFLCRVLRDPVLIEALAPGFRWHYELTACCALGLSRRLWPKAFPDATSSTATRVLARYFGLSPHAAGRVFFGGFPRVGRLEEITPVQVADVLEHELEFARTEGQARYYFPRADSLMVVVTWDFAETSAPELEPEEPWGVPIEAARTPEPAAARVLELAT